MYTYLFFYWDVGFKHHQHSYNNNNSLSFNMHVFWRVWARIIILLRHSYVSSSRTFILREYQKPRSKITKAEEKGGEGQEPRGERKLKSKAGAHGDENSEAEEKSKRKRGRRSALWTIGI